MRCNVLALAGYAVEKIEAARLGRAASCNKLTCQDSQRLRFRLNELYLRVGTRQASHTSAITDGTNAAKYPSIRRFIAPVSIVIDDRLPKRAMTYFEGRFRAPLFFPENS